METSKEKRFMLDPFHWNYVEITSSIVRSKYSAVKLMESSQVPVIPGVPLIPGITASENKLRGIAGLLGGRGIDAATLLPYNPWWSDKAASFAKKSAYLRSKFMMRREKQQCAALFHAADQGLSFQSRKVVCPKIIRPGFLSTKCNAGINLRCQLSAAPRIEHLKIS